MNTPEQTDYLRVFEVLEAGGVRYVVVGGLAAVLAGAPLVTLDVDIVHERADDNIARLLDALNVLRAVYRDEAGRAIPPNSEYLKGPGHHLFRTTAGNLDVLGEVAGGLTYRDLVPRAHRTWLSPELQVPVLELAALIELKAATGRAKDLAVLRLLQSVLEERARSD